jgi:hypothetical protein
MPNSSRISNHYPHPIRWNLPTGWVISARPAHSALVSEADYIAAQDASVPRGPVVARGRHRAMSIFGITVSDEEVQERTPAEPPIWSGGLALKRLVSAAPNRT